MDYWVFAIFLRLHSEAGTASATILQTTQKNHKFIITQGHHECLDILKKSLIDATKISLRFPFEGQTVRDNDRCQYARSGIRLAYRRLHSKGRK